MDRFSIKVGLCRGVLASGAPLAFRVRGNSMLPALASGDSIFVRHAEPSDAAPGDVVVFARSGHFVAHRVVRRSTEAQGSVLVTRGDACVDDDPPVAQDELLGVVTGVVRLGAAGKAPSTPPRRRAAWRLALRVGGERARRAVAALMRGAPFARAPGRGP